MDIDSPEAAEWSKLMSRISVKEYKIVLLRDMLQECRSVVASLDEMALGGQHANHPEEQEWYFRDELLSRIDAV